MPSGTLLGCSFDLWSKGGPVPVQELGHTARSCGFLTEVYSKWLCLHVTNFRSNLLGTGAGLFLQKNVRMSLVLFI